MLLNLQSTLVDYRHTFIFFFQGGFILKTSLSNKTLYSVSSNYWYAIQDANNKMWNDVLDFGRQHFQCVQAAPSIRRTQWMMFARIN